MRPAARVHASDRLTLQEANHLAAVLASRVAAASGLRVVVIKGLALAEHALRADRVSADVDVLLDSHEAVGELAEALASHGWRPRPGTFGSARMTTHSLTLSHPRWPNDLDVLGEFPGLSGPAFEAIWSTRKAMLGGQRCWIPDPWSLVVIWALPSLRSSEEQPRHVTELADVVDGVLPTLSAFERNVLATRITQLGAAPAFGTTRGFDTLLAGRHLPSETNEAWQRTLEKTHSLTPWLQVLRDAPRRERPLVLWHALWPNAHDLRVMDPELVDTPLGRLIARARRWVKLARRARRFA